jgi:hypothetical protein
MFILNVLAEFINIDDKQLQTVITNTIDELSHKQLVKLNEIALKLAKDTEYIANHKCEICVNEVNAFRALGSSEDVHSAAH